MPCGQLISRVTTFTFVLCLTTLNVSGDEVLSEEHLAPVTLCAASLEDVASQPIDASEPIHARQASLNVWRPTAPVGESNCDIASACDLVCPSWVFGVDYLYWRPRMRGMDFAVTEDGTAQTIGRGRVQNLELDRKAGIRTMIGYRTKTNWALAFEYTNYDTSGYATALRPPGVGELFATRSHPDTNEEADIAFATGGLDYQVFDILGSRSIYDNRFSHVRIFGGVRFADIGQLLRTEYDGRDFVDGVVESSLNMDAFGFRLGAESHWQMAYGFGLFGRVAGSLMHGRFQTRLFESNLLGAQVITDIQDDYEQAVPVLDVVGGISWQRGGLLLSAGYELTNWFNLSNRAAFIDDIHEALYGPFETDVLLEGLTASASFAW